MKKILMLIAAVLVMAAPTFAQSAFSDVPSDHWAYGAISQLEASGMVIGYPDGEFKGKRNLTRYEFAMIVAKLLPFLKDTDLKVDSFVTKNEIKDLVKKGEISLDGYAKASDLEAITKLANEFKPELAQLGVDVNALNADVNALKTKVAALEAEQQRVVITGNLNILGRFATSVKTENYNGVELEGDARYVIDQDGRAMGKGFSRGDKLIKDFQIDIKGKVSNSITAYMSLVAGDYMTYMRSSQAKTGATKNKTLNIDPYYLYASMDWNKYGKMNLGLMPFQINKYVYQRYNDNSYYNVARLADGNYRTDGVDYAKDWGVVDLRAWLFKPEYNAQGGASGWDATLFAPDNNTPRAYGTTGQVNYMGGLQLGFDISTAKLDILYNRARGDIETIKTSDIYGAMLNIPFGSVKFDTAFYNQKAKDQDSAKLFDVNLGLDWKGLKVGLGYLDVAKGYEAPANYEAMAYIINPNNVKGMKAYASYDWGKLNLMASYKDYKAKDEDVATGSTYYGMGNDGKIKDMVLGIAYNTGSWGTFGFKYENLKTQNIDTAYPGTYMGKADVRSNYYTLDWKKVVGNSNFRLGIQRAETKDSNSEAKANGTIFFGQAGYTF